MTRIDIEIEPSKSEKFMLDTFNRLADGIIPLRGISYNRTIHKDGPD